MQKKERLIHQNIKSEKDFKKKIGHTVRRYFESPATMSSNGLFFLQVTCGGGLCVYCGDKVTFRNMEYFDYRCENYACYKCQEILDNEGVDGRNVPFYKDDKVIIH